MDTAVLAVQVFLRTGSAQLDELNARHIHVRLRCDIGLSRLTNL